MIPIMIHIHSYNNLRTGPLTCYIHIEYILCDISLRSRGFGPTPHKGIEVYGYTLNNNSYRTCGLDRSDDGAWLEVR